MTDEKPARKPFGKRPGPSQIDVHVGVRVKQRRVVLGFTQDRLAKELGITFQQIQKYERGTNRIGASRLHDISRVLSAPVSYFFDDMPPAGENAAPGMAEAKQEPFENDPMGRRETLELVRAYYRIPDSQVRRRLFEMVKALAANSTAASDDQGPNSQRQNSD